MTLPDDMNMFLLTRHDLAGESIGANESEAAMDTYISRYNLACESIWAGELENAMEIYRELLGHDNLPLLIRARANIDLAWIGDRWQDAQRHLNNAEATYRRMCELVEPACLNEKWSLVISDLRELERYIAHRRLEESKVNIRTEAS